MHFISLLFLSFLDCSPLPSPPRARVTLSALYFISRYFSIAQHISAAGCVLSYWVGKLFQQAARLQHCRRRRFLLSSLRCARMSTAAAGDDDDDDDAVN